MWWQMGLLANAVVAAAYLMIAWAIVRPLVREGQLASNRLGAVHFCGTTAHWWHILGRMSDVPHLLHGAIVIGGTAGATAAIFLTCAVHHGSHTVHMALPYLGLVEQQGQALRAAYNWQSGTWDVLTAAVGSYYWTLRRTYGSLMHGAKLFEDMRAREQQALELNDSVLQGLVVAKMAIEMGQPAKATEAMEASIGAASTMITELLGARAGDAGGGLLRTSAATLTEPVQ